MKDTAHKQHQLMRKGKELTCKIVKLASRMIFAISSLARLDDVGVPLMT